MRNGAAETDETTGHARLRPLLLLAALGMALLFSATWTERADASELSTWVVYATRFTTFSTYMVVAYLFRNHLPPVDLLLRVGLSFLALRLIATAAPLALPLDATSLAAARYAASLFEGVANALLTLVYAHVFSCFSPRRSAVGIAVSYLLVDVCILGLDLLDTTALRATQVAFVIASALVLAWCVRRMLGLGHGGPAADHDLQYGMARVEGESAHPLAFLTQRLDWLLLLVVALLFPTLFGLIAQVSSTTGGNFALYDVTTEIAMIALQALFLLYMGALGGRFGFASILAFSVPLYATGFALFPGSWAGGNPFAGCLIRGGYVVLTVLIWSLMARKSFEDPRHTYLYFGIYCGVSNAQLGRLVGSLLMGEAGPSAQLCASISLAALWCICMFGLAAFFLLRRSAGPRSAAEFATPVAQEVSPQAKATAAPGNVRDDGAPGSVDDAAARETVPEPAGPVDTFAARLEAFAARTHLAPREREVLVETARGYSRTNIARKLALSPETVKTYQGRIYGKAGVTSKQELIALVEREPFDASRR